MESISKKLGFLLEGKPYEEMFEFCDFSLSDQNEATQAKGVQASADWCMLYHVKSMTGRENATFEGDLVKRSLIDSAAKCADALVECHLMSYICCLENCPRPPREDSPCNQDGTLRH